MTTMVLVACSAKKAPAPCPARDLYQGALFRKARAYAEASGQTWAILSALHGLVEPQTVLVPYDNSLKGATQEERRKWTLAVVEAIERRHNPDRVILLAGEDYAAPLWSWLIASGICVDRPLRGLGIGQQMQRLVQMTREVRG